ncbi:hypothetical protein [Nocardiopsis protaetiae]|uniref:hypothetical protein n=1 Tax=Nocardiopsis protaetiae TaxID=3382270 RepID=UPI00387AF0F5
MANDVETNRVTIDVDATVRIEVGAFTYSDAALVLEGLGYAVEDRSGLAYRFDRDGKKADLMVADHTRPQPTYRGRKVMAIPGGNQALGRLQEVAFQLDGGQVMIPVPTLHGALVLKAAAHKEDNRDRARHLLDAITLLACVIDIEPIIGDLKGSDRRRLLYLIRMFDEHKLVVAQAPPDTVGLAEQTLNELRDSLSLFHPEGAGHSPVPVSLKPF